ncbi:MAG: WD40 repeat domain-containing protein [Myxococcota bacterium]
MPLDRLERLDDQTGWADAPLSGATFSGGLRFFTEDGQRIPVREPSGAPIIDDRFVLHIEAETGRLLKTARYSGGNSEDGVVARAQVIDDGLRLIAALPDQTVRIWTLEDGALVGADLPDAAGDVFAVSTDGRYLLAGNTVLDLVDGQTRFEVTASQTAIWDPITGFLFTGDTVGISFWALELDEKFQELAVDGGVFAMQPIVDGRLLVAGPAGVWIFPAP